jgi:hypothetical protein
VSIPERILTDKHQTALKIHKDMRITMKVRRKRKETKKMKMTVMKRSKEMMMRNMWKWGMNWVMCLGIKSSWIR